MQFLQTDPGYIHGLCKQCEPEEVIKIPVAIVAALVDNETGIGVTAKVDAIDLQPMYDHQLLVHGPKLD